MRCFQLDKLVRDGVFADMQAMGQQVDYCVLEGDEYWAKWREKVIEEVREFDPNSPTAFDEMGDVQEIIKQGIIKLGGTEEQVADSQAKKRERAGSFAGGYFVRTITLADDDPWTQYYAADPERFPELPVDEQSATSKNLRQETIDTYNHSARELAEFFRGIGPRTKHIDEAFELAGNPPDARVVEIGCGDGRDAKEIVKHAGWYLGLDISKEFIKLAKAYVPEGNFEVADAATARFPENLDVIFAFASLLHLDKDEVKTVLASAHKALRSGGIFYISLKYRPRYEQEVIEDSYGRRLFYFYNDETLVELAGDGYEVAKTRHETHGHTDWLEIALRRI